MRPDLELLAAWRGGDTVAGDELVSRHWPSISRFFRAKVGDASADLIAQTFLACVEARDRIAGDDLRAYLFAIARRRLAEHFRTTSRETPVDFGTTSLADLLDPATGVITQLDRKQRADLLRAALAHIPVDDAIALELAYLENLPLRDVAQILDLHPNTIRSRLSRARSKLRAALSSLSPSPDAALADSTLDDSTLID